MLWLLWRSEKRTRQLFSGLVYLCHRRPCTSLTTLVPNVVSKSGVSWCKLLSCRQLPDVRSMRATNPAIRPQFDEDATMIMKTVLHGALVAALFASCGTLLAQEAQKTPPQAQEAPSVDSIIGTLKTDNAEQSAGQTRALRPGAASMATTAPAPAPVATKPAKPASINMQINFEFNSDRISGSSENTMANLAADNLIDFLLHGKALTPLNPEVLGQAG